MPNWITGSLKLRGKYDNILNFFENGLNIYEHHCDADTGETIETVRNKADWLNIEGFDEDGSRACEITIGDHWVYIEGTKRAFVSGSPCIFLEETDDPCIASMEVNQAWGFRPEDFLHIAEKYNLDIRLWGLEAGMGFGQEIVIENGELVKDETMTYEDFQWEAPLPWFGG